NLRGTPPRLLPVCLQPCQVRFLSYVSRPTRAPRSIVLGDDFAVSLGAQGTQGQQTDLLADELDRAVGEGQVGPTRVLAAVDTRPLVVQVAPRRAALGRCARIKGGGQLPVQLLQRLTAGVGRAAEPYAPSGEVLVRGAGGVEERPAWFVVGAFAHEDG